MIKKNDVNEFEYEKIESEEIKELNENEQLEELSIEDESEIEGGAVVDLDSISTTVINVKQPNQYSAMLLVSFDFGPMRSINRGSWYYGWKFSVSGSRKNIYIERTRESKIKHVDIFWGYNGTDGKKKAERIGSLNFNNEEE